MTETTATETQACDARAMLLNAIRDVQGHPVAIVPLGTAVVDLEPYLSKPLTKRAKASFGDAQSFVGYLNEHKLPETRIFAQVNATGGRFTALIDFHGGAADAVGKNKHTAEYGLVFTEEWKRWNQFHGKAFAQKEFARFLEDNMVDIVLPPGAEVLDVARTLEATTTVNFKQGVRLDNGNESLVYEQTTQAKAGEKGELEIPREFALRIPVFERQSTHGVVARLRYRIDDGHLSFTYELVRPHKIVEEAIQTVQEMIEKETGIGIYRGSVQT